MSYLPHTDDDRSAMLETIGVDSLEALFESIPRELRFPEVALPKPLSEPDTEQAILALASGNVPATQGRCFLGAGAYQHYIPATVDEVLRNSEFYSAYTPYQPEASQGMLQAMFEYQTMVCRLTAMDVSNASHYDGASALAEAVLVALSATPRSRTEVVVASGLHPQYRAVVETYLSGTDASIVSPSDRYAQSAGLAHLLSDRTAAVVVQNPDFFGHFEALDALSKRVHDEEALLIVVPDPISLGMFKPPGDYGADLVAADGQPLGIPLSFGGPHLGIFATTNALLRRSVGRLVGETVDSRGQRGYVLTMSTREQHIRREKATSNICTNAALTALAAAVYMATVGKSGMRRIAELCYQRSHYAASRLGALAGCDVNPYTGDRLFFKEFMLRVPCEVEPLNEFLLAEYGIVGGYDLGLAYPDLARHMLLAFTELTNRDRIDELSTGIERFVKLRASHE